MMSPARTVWSCSVGAGYPYCSKPTSLIVRRSWWSERRCNNVTTTELTGHVITWRVTPALSEDECVKMSGGKYR
jgi:hypothetical protein